MEQDLVVWDQEPAEAWDHVVQALPLIHSLDVAEDAVTDGNTAQVESPDGCDMVIQ